MFWSQISRSAPEPFVHHILKSILLPSVKATVFFAYCRPVGTPINHYDFQSGCRCRSEVKQYTMTPRLPALSYKLCRELCWGSRTTRRRYNSLKVCGLVLPKDHCESELMCRLRGEVPFT
ncbi:hypothetical protein TNCV_2829941 [Trichonephila clavipes]|nr:hypothetical protein TNCV_2829941 [Trichonephila clavipes]